MARQRGDSSSGWRNRDTDEASGGWIVPVDGGFGTLSGSYAGGFLQWMDDFGLLWSVWRGDSSSGWRFWDCEWLVCGWIVPVTGGFGTARVLLVRL